MSKGVRIFEYSTLLKMCY